MNVMVFLVAGSV